MARPHRQPSEPSEPSPRTDAPASGAPLPVAVPLNAAPGPAREHPLDTLGTLACILIVLITIGFVCLRMFPGAFLTGSANATVGRAFFTSINAVTSTGFAQTWCAVSEYTLAGQILIASLAIVGTGVTWLGGGVLLCRAAKFRVAWKELFIATGVILVLAVPASIPAALGWFDAASAVTGLGLTAFTTPYTPAQQSLHFAALPLFVAGALGPVLLIAAVRLFRRRGVPELLLLTLAFLAASYAISAVVLMPMLGSKYSVPQTLAASSAFALNARGLGTAIGQLSDLPPPAVWVQFALMLIGRPLNAIPIVLVLLAGHRLVRNQLAPRTAGVAIAWIMFHLALVFATVVVLAISDRQLSPDRALFIAVSSVGNIGLSHDPLSLSPIGAGALSVAMALGQLLPLTMLAWMARVAEQSADEAE
jgi:hypothetical protein